jgi:hypothetical protein
MIGRVTTIDAAVETFLSCQSTDHCGGRHSNLRCPSIETFATRAAFSRMALARTQAFDVPNPFQVTELPLKPLGPIHQLCELRSVSSMISFDNIQVSRFQKPGQPNRGAPHGQNRPRPSDHHPQFRSLNCRAQ